ncbi:IS1634 family transposase [Rhodopila globiformis]|uniref:Transposase n=1 Tax=Rhodopila globiformis TaxID=1071 RepID=A0A2S6NPB9_RHOGL|nr:transposase [Rhodopila globiformis]PPQ40817.1 transposase [Rhodopila globiformis]
MYLRITERRNRDGFTVAYYALAENVWNAQAKRSEAQVIHNFGRADQLDKAALQRRIASIQCVIAADAVDALPTSGKASLPDIATDAVFELGVVLAARGLWEELGIGEAIRTRLMRAQLSAPHEMALFAMAAQRLDDPGSKLSCATRWLPDIAWLPEADNLAVDQLYRALDFLAVWSDEIERDVFLHSADLFRLDVDLIFYDTTAYFEIDEPDEHCELWAGKLFAPLRQRGHNKEGRDNQPQVIIAMAVTRDGMPVRSWARLAKVPPASAGGMPDEGLPGNTADVATVARIKQDLHAWRLGRCLFVGDAGMYSADNLVELSRGLGRYVLAVPMRRLKDVETEVLTRPGRYRKVADNLEVKEVWVGDGERRKRYVLCFNPAEAAQQRAHRAQVLAELAAELTLLDERHEDHPKAACALMASRRYGRYLSMDRHARPKLDAAKVKAVEKFDGKWVVITNDETLTAEDVALAYKGGAIIESCFRRMKQTGLEVRPMFHWAPRRIEAHVKLCVLALQVQRTAEIRTGLSWARIAHLLGTLQAVRYVAERQTIVQRTKIGPELAGLLKTLGISAPKQVMAMSEATDSPATS